MINLRPYQEAAIEDIRKAFASHRRVLLVMGTGLGKTVIFSYIAAGTSRAGKRVLIIAHRRELLKQISRALKMVGVRHAVMTGGYRGIPTAQVVVASVFTLAKRIAYFPAPDLIVGDEAHHFTPDSTWGKVVNHFPKARVLGVTATPERLDGKGLGLMFDFMVMGPPIAESVEQGYLSRADVYAPSVPLLTGARTRMGDYVVGDLEDAMDKPSITGSAVEHYRKLADGKKAIAFCVSIKHAKDVAEQFRDAGYTSSHIDGGMDERERDRVLRRFEDGDIQVLTSCDLVSEGFDLPAVEVAILLRPTKSLSLFLQQCLDEETEILTKRGWVGRAEIGPDDIAAAYEIGTGKIHWSPVRSITDRPLADGEDVFSVAGPHLNIRVTGGHNMIVGARGAKGYKKIPAHEMAQRQGMHFIPVSGVMDVPDAAITDSELRLLGWFLSDGTRNKINNAICIAQSEKKTEHLRSIEDALKGSGIKYGRCVVKRTGDYAKYPALIHFTFSYGKPRGRDKHLSGYAHLSEWMDKSIPDVYDSLSARQLLVLLETLNLGDGSNMYKPKGWIKRGMSITTGANEPMADRLQALMVTRGIRCNKSRSHTEGKSPQFFLNISFKDSATLPGVGCKDGAVRGKKPYKRSRFERSPTSVGEMVWCVETDYGTIVTRRRGRVAIVGNCGRAIRPSPGKTHTIILDHAGNTHRHGFIDEPRDWQLTDGSVREKRDAVPSVRTCPKCFAAHRPMPVCPKCGHTYELKSRKVDHVDGELELTSRSDDVQKASAENDIQRRFSVLKSIGKSRKYGNPERWAFNVICGQEAARLSKMRDPVNRSMVNGLTEEERSAIWKMTMGRATSPATASP